MDEDTNIFNALIEAAGGLGTAPLSPITVKPAAYRYISGSDPFGPDYGGKYQTHLSLTSEVTTPDELINAIREASSKLVNVTVSFDWQDCYLHFRGDLPAKEEKK